MGVFYYLFLLLLFFVFIFLQVKIFDLSTASSDTLLKGHSQPITSLSFDHHASHTLVSGSEDRRVHVYDCRSHTSHPSTFLRGHSAAIRSVQMDGWKVVSGRYASLCILPWWSHTFSCVSWMNFTLWCQRCESVCEFSYSVYIKESQGNKKIEDIVSLYENQFHKTLVLYEIHKKYRSIYCNCTLSTTLHKWSTNWLIFYGFLGYSRVEGTFKSQIFTFPKRINLSCESLLFTHVVH